MAPHAQIKTHPAGWPRFSAVPHYPELAKPESDGPFCFFLQRRISILLSPTLAGHVTPNAATGLNFSMGLAAAGLFLMGHWLAAVWLLTVSSEKFRSSYERGYPKRQLEPIFAWLSGGSDVRLLVLSVGFALAQVRDQAIIGLWTMAALALLTHVNFLVRIYRVSRRFASRDAHQDVSP